MSLFLSSCFFCVISITCLSEMPPLLYSSGRAQVHFLPEPHLTISLCHSLKGISLVLKVLSYITFSSTNLFFFSLFCTSWSPSLSSHVSTVAICDTTENSEQKLDSYFSHMTNENPTDFASSPLSPGTCTSFFRCIWVSCLNR